MNVFSYSLGRRYEKLLFMAGPISLICIIIFFISIASSNDKPRLEERCQNMAIRVLGNVEPKLNKAWIESSKAKPHSMASLSYELALQNAWIYGALQTHCYNIINRILEKNANIAPENLLGFIRSQAAKSEKAIDDTPLQYWGVEIPGTAQINIFGTNISISANSLAVALQITMLPVILLWLSSLYNTRVREILVLDRLSEPQDIFPHITNLFYIEIPILKKKRSVLRPYRFKVFGVIYAVLRSLLLVMFIAPPIVFYLMSIYLTIFSSEMTLTIIAICVVGLFFLSNIILEFHPWNINKHFSTMTSSQP